MADNSLEGWIGKQINFGRPKKDIAKMLNESGFKSEAGESITTADINRFMAGDENSIIVPEDADLPEPPKSAPTPKGKVTAIVDQFLPLVEEKPEETTPPEVEELEDLAHELEEHEARRSELEAELQDDVEAQKERDEHRPPKVPRPSDYTHTEHVGPAQHARVSGIFSPRAPIELDENESTFFNIPRLKRKPVEVRTRPHEVTHFGANVLSTRDLSIRQKKRA